MIGITAPPTLIARIVPGQSTLHRRQKRHAEKLHHLPRHDALPRQADQRQIDVRAEQGAEQHQHGDAGIEAEGGIGVAQQADLNKKQKTNQNREKQGRDADADRKVMHVAQGRRPPEAGGAGGGRRNAHAPASAAMILSA